MLAEGVERDVFFQYHIAVLPRETAWPDVQPRCLCNRLSALHTCWLSGPAFQPVPRDVYLRQSLRGSDARLLLSYLYPSCSLLSPFLLYVYTSIFYTCSIIGYFSVKVKNRRSPIGNMQSAKLCRHPPAFRLLSTQLLKTPFGLFFSY